jgi:hypothetical protein
VTRKPYCCYWLYHWTERVLGLVRADSLTESVPEDCSVRILDFGPIQFTHKSLQTTTGLLLRVGNEGAGAWSRGLAPGTLFRNRLLDLLLADGLQLLVLRGAKNFL